MIAKVLLVDDESPFVEALAKRLKLRELEVAIALSGPEALEKLEHELHNRRGSARRKDAGNGRH